MTPSRKDIQRIIAKLELYQARRADVRIHAQALGAIAALQYVIGPAHTPPDVLIDFCEAVIRNEAKRLRRQK